MAKDEIYCIDSSSLMEWQARYYPIEIFPGVEKRISELISEKRLITPALVQEEIKAVGTTDLTQWLKNNKEIIIPTNEILKETMSIQNQFSGLRDPKAEYDEADAYVIALAQIKKGIVLTQETSAAEKRNPKRTHYIPDVCRELGITCISFLGLMRREAWKF